MEDQGYNYTTLTVNVLSKRPASNTAPSYVSFMSVCAQIFIIYMHVVGILNIQLNIKYPAAETNPDQLFALGFAFQSHTASLFVQ